MTKAMTFKRWCELFSPWALGPVRAAVAAWSLYCQRKDGLPGSTLGEALDISAVITGFLGVALSIVISTSESNPVLQTIKKAGEWPRLLSMTLRAFYVVAGWGVISIGLLAARTLLRWEQPKWVDALWCGLGTTALVSAYYAIKIFGTVVIAGAKVPGPD